MLVSLDTILIVRFPAVKGGGKLASQVDLVDLVCLEAGNAQFPSAERIQIT